MKVFLSVLLISMLLSSCSTTQHLKQEQKIERNYFSITWNTATWDFAKSKENFYVGMEKGNWSDGKGNDSQNILIPIHKKVLHEGEYVWLRYADFSISSVSYERYAEYMLKNDVEIFFDKNADYSMVSRNPDGVPKLMTINRFYKRTYNKKWEKINYINGLKCLDSTYLINNRSKLYKIYCGYYDKSMGKRIFRINFDYESRNFQKGYDWDEISKTGEIPHIQPIERLIKQAAKQIIATIKIKNFDRERMEKEGLIHYDKKFELSEY